MWVNIDDLMAELERLERKTKEEFDGEENSNFKTLLYQGEEAIRWLVHLFAGRWRRNDCLP